jgi:predicted GNAT superfamily acetyltransferase
VIREYRTSDLSSIWQINQENVPAVGESTEAELGEIARMSQTALVIDVDGDVGGFCFVLPPATDYDSPNYRYFCDRFPDFIYLDRVAITAKHRGRGFGAELYREVEHRSSAPLFALEVNVIPPNEGSLRFHHREGFVEIDRLETRPGKVVSLMIKRIGQPTDTVFAHD